MENRVAPFTLPSPQRALPPPLIRLEKVSVGYDGQPVLKNLNLSLDPDDRIGLLGVNGAGKSTFAKMIAGALPPLSGTVHRDRRMEVGWFHQHQIEALDPNDTPVEIIRRALPDAAESQRRSKLAQFGLGIEKQDTTVANLSGGERARLLLNLVAMAAPHLLILDEPTNHLDIDSRRALLDALNDYEGAVILITHDRSLMDLVADRLWLAADGQVKPYEGDMEDYASLVLERARAAAKAEAEAARAAAPPAPPKAKPKPRGAAAAAPLRRKMEAAETVMHRSAEALEKIDTALADPALYSQDPAKARALSAKREAAQAALHAAEHAWMEAAEAYEAALAD